MDAPNLDSGTGAPTGEPDTAEAAGMSPDVAGRRWLRRSAVVYRRLLVADRPDAGDALRLVAETACELADADLAAVLVPTAEHTELCVEVAVGRGAQELEGQAVAVDEPRSPPAGDPHPRVPGGWPPEELGPTRTLPLTGAHLRGGALVVGRLRGRPELTGQDAALLADLAVHASVAHALAAARAEHEQVAVLADRARIATELYDDVLRRLFVTGMALHGLAADLVPGAAADRLQAAVIDLDRTINHIQRTLFALHDRSTGELPEGGARLAGAIAELTGSLGFEPATRVTGSLNDLPPDVLADVRAVVREALTNVARHARARAAEVAVTVAGGAVTVQVTDDGVGLTKAPGSGLADLRRRARWHGGSLTVQPVPTGGTRLTWTVPVR